MKGKPGYLIVFIFIAALLLSSCKKTNPIEVTLKINAEVKDQQLRITGTTNLPNDMELTMLMQRKGADIDFKSEETIIVKDGSFTGSWIGDERRPYNKLKPGEYSIQIQSKSPSRQPASVKDIIGKNAEYLDGPCVMQGSDGKIVTYNMNAEIKGENLSIPIYLEEGKDIKFTLEEISEGLEKNGFSLKKENIEGNEAIVAQDPQELIRVELIGDPADIGLINVMTNNYDAAEAKNYFKNILSILFPKWADSESWITGYFDEELAKSDPQANVGKTINYGSKYITVNGIKTASKVEMTIGPNK